VLKSPCDEHPGFAAVDGQGGEALKGPSVQRDLI
jgi:hypothetical protein